MNNSLVAASTVALTGYPDLYPVSFALPISVVAGVQFDLQMTVQNRGAITVPGGWLAQLLLSVLPPNPTPAQIAAAYSTGSPVDLSVGSFTHTADIAPGATVTITKSITLPLTYASLSGTSYTNKPLMGSYYFEVRLDYTGIVTEGMETNNNRKMTTTRSVLQPPDLVPAQVTGPATAAAGDQISVNARVVNSGNGTAASGWRGGIYLVGGASPIMVHQYVESGVASPSAALVSTRLFFLPATVTPGTYQLRLIVDETAVIAEANSSGNGETNNVLDGGSMTVTP
jgi:hypothetical protein